MSSSAGLRYGNSKEKQVAMVTKGEDYFAILQYDDIQCIEGRLLTFVEAMNTDKEQREAQKSVVRTMVWEWSRNLFLRNWNQDYPVADSHSQSNGKTKKSRVNIIN